MRLPGSNPTRRGPVDELAAATEAIRKMPWTQVQQLRGDAQVLEQIDEATELLQALRQSLGATPPGMETDQ
jgi:ParB family chromosome partitioning protein